MIKKRAFFCFRLICNFIITMSLLMGTGQVSAQIDLSQKERIGSNAPDAKVFQPGSGSPSTLTYKLPFEEGAQHEISRGGTDHGNAYDFKMDVGTIIRAVIGGTIENVTESNDCQSLRPGAPRFNANCQNNQFRIKQDDGKYGFYLHFQKNGVLTNPRSKEKFKKGDRIEQGDDLALSGDVGISTGPHLHYDEADDSYNEKKILVNFVEAPGNNKYLNGRGITSPKSQNTPSVPPCPTPTNNQIILYSNTDRNNLCSGKGEGMGYARIQIPLANDVAGGGVDFAIKSVAFPPSCSSQNYSGLDPNRQYKIQSIATNLVLDVEGGSIADQARVVQWEAHGGSNQRWKFQPVNGSQDEYQIKPISGIGLSDNGELCLSATADGKVNQRKCSQGQSAQIWKVTKQGEGFTIASKTTIPEHSGWTLDVPGGNSNWGLQMIIWSPNNGTNQFWRIDDVMEVVLGLVDSTDPSKYIVLNSNPSNLSDNLSSSTNLTDFYVFRNYQLCKAGGISANGVNSCSGPLPQNQPPRAPVLIQPGNSSASLYKAPQLCWSGRGDADGNSLEYQVDIFDSPINLSSGWKTGTCWVPSELDNQFHTYQWRVKSRDIFLAESPWSDTRSFTVKSPNAPPAISFAAANGDSSETILSNNSSWTFTGTASDPENDLRQIEFRCSGDGCGSNAAHSDGNNWSHTQNVMLGENDVYFVAYDGYGNNMPSRHVKLLIDQAPPTTLIGLNNQSISSAWPVWYTGPVQVSLTAQDGASGRARAGVDRLYYRIDGGDWQSVQGETTVQMVSSDGGHIVETYAVDRLGNPERAHSASFQIDQTPPSPPADVTETHETLSGVWQKKDNIPTFTWPAATDATSGLDKYQFYFDTDPAGIGYTTIAVSDPREWTPRPDGVRTGTYYLRGRSKDVAGNWSAWTDLFEYRYDGTAPENPSGVVHSLPVQSTVWQRITSAPDFSWPVPHDEGSGIQGYQYYWGVEEQGTSSELLTEPRFQQADGLCPASACTAYLRLRSVDNVDNLAGEWTTAFILRYDDSPPSADFVIDGGEGTTHQTQVKLTINAFDLGSGLKAMRFSRDGVNWTDWEKYAPQRDWQIYPISGVAWPIYVQVKDGVDLVSTPVFHTVTLDVNPEEPKSSNFRLYDQAQVAGSSSLASTGFSSHGTLGQTTDAPPARSESFMVWGGYEAGSQGPMDQIMPVHGAISLLNGAMVSGNGATLMASSGYQMVGATGEAALPNNQPDLTSAGFRHQPGFLAAAPAPLMPKDTAGEPPVVEAVPSCTVPSLQINAGKEFTNRAEVVLNLCAPHAVKMKISNDQDMQGAEWEPYTTSKTWTLDDSGQEVQARFVYAKFQDASNVEYRVYLDDIILDRTLPEGGLLLTDDSSYQQFAQAADVRTGILLPQNSHSAIQASLSARDSGAISMNPDGSVNLMVDATDNNSGLVEMELSLNPDFSQVNWEPFAPLKTWTPPDGLDGWKTIFSRFRDSAGNVSVTNQITFLLDRQAPYGSLWMKQNTLQPTLRQVALELYAGDDLLDDNGALLIPGSGVVEMRLGDQADLSGAVWQPYQNRLTWPVDLANKYEGKIYVQFRDQAGNISAISSTQYLVDMAAPELHAALLKGSGLNRTLQINAWDDLSSVGKLYLSNDPLMVSGVVSLDYDGAEIPWTFDSQRVVWIQAEDSAGNLSRPVALFAHDEEIKVFVPAVTNH
jgi:hypothetical protein